MGIDKPPAACLIWLTFIHKPKHIDPGLSVYEGKTAYAVAPHEWVNGGNGICIFMCSGK